jgi:hypothetical protein
MAAHARPRLPLRLEQGLSLRGERLHIGPPHPPYLTLAAPISLATRLSPAEARALLGAVGLGDIPTLGRPSLWRPPPGGRLSAVATLAKAATAAWAEDTLAGLADTGTTLADGTELLVGHIAFAADGPAFTLPADDGDPPGLRRAGR